MISVVDVFCNSNPSQEAQLNETMANGKVPIVASSFSFSDIYSNI